tara:strand:+ start:6789 stop:6974 length:186 start_codon:yes stop_codon:yes gene_type:complete
MGVTIEPTVNADTYWVNSKEVYQDSNGNWIAKEELTPSETNAFKCYIGREIKLKNRPVTRD